MLLNEKNVSPTGDGLGIIINCDYYKAHQWMSFGFWHSIYTNIPDAKVIVAVPRDKVISPFKWTYRCKVPFHTYSKDLNLIAEKFMSKLDVKIFLPNLIALRAYNKENLGPSEAKSDDFTTFIDYSTGCGKFVLSQRIDNYVSPFGKVASRLAGENMTVNESKILAYWDSLDLTYKAVS